MMDLGPYLIGIIAAALICAVVSQISPNSSAGAVIRLATGIFMMLALITPFLNLRIRDLQFYFDDIRAEGQRLTQEGKIAGQMELRKRISGQVRTYILDKASTMGAVLDVEVELEEWRPCAVTLRGAVSPYTKDVLEHYIANELGICKEDQRWIS